MTVEVEVAAVATVARLSPQPGRLVGQPQKDLARIPAAVSTVQSDARVHVRELGLLVETTVRLEAAAYLGAKGTVAGVVGGGGAGAVEGREGGGLREVANVLREEPSCEGRGVIGDLKMLRLQSVCAVDTIS